MPRFTPFLLAALLFCAFPAHRPPVAAQSLTKIQPPKSLDDVRFEELAPGVWRDISYDSVSGLGPYPANGLVAFTKNGVLVVDPGWTPTHGKNISKWIRERAGNAPLTVIPTHFHYDRVGGLPGIPRRKGNHILVFDKTVELLKDDAKKLPVFETFNGEKTITLGSETYDVFYPGPGHTTDNIVIYCRSSRVLFGGCFVKSLDSSGLGNVADADVERWSASIDAVFKRFPDIKVVVPGHGDPGGVELLTHTQELLKKAKK